MSKRGKNRAKTPDEATAEKAAEPVAVPPAVREPAGAGLDAGPGTDAVAPVAADAAGLDAPEPAAAADQHGADGNDLDETIPAILTEDGLDADMRRAWRRTLKALLQAPVAEGYNLWRVCEELNDGAMNLAFANALVAPLGLVFDRDIVPGGYDLCVPTQCDVGKHHLSTIEDNWWSCLKLMPVELRDVREVAFGDETLVCVTVHIMHALEWYDGEEAGDSDETDADLAAPRQHNPDRSAGAGLEWPLDAGVPTDADSTADHSGGEGADIFVAGSERILDALFPDRPEWDNNVVAATFAASHVYAYNAGGFAGFNVDDDMIDEPAFHRVMHHAAGFVRGNPDAPADAIAIDLRLAGFAGVPETGPRELVAWDIFRFALHSLDALDRRTASAAAGQG